MVDFVRFLCTFQLIKLVYLTLSGVASLALTVQAVQWSIKNIRNGNILNGIAGIVLVPLCLAPIVILILIFPF